MDIRQALTFDDVSIEPAASNVLPGQANLRTRLTTRIDLGIPILSAAMDTVTEARLAIAIAQAGGIGAALERVRVAAAADAERLGGVLGGAAERRDVPHGGVDALEDGADRE